MDGREGVEEFEERNGMPLTEECKRRGLRMGVLLAVARGGVIGGGGVSVANGSLAADKESETEERVEGKVVEEEPEECERRGLRICTPPVARGGVFGGGVSADERSKGSEAVCLVGVCARELCGLLLLALAPPPTESRAALLFFLRIKRGLRIK